MGIHHQDAPSALRATSDFDAEAASEDRMQHISYPRWGLSSIFHHKVQLTREGIA